MDVLAKLDIRIEAIRRHTEQSHPKYLVEMERDLDAIRYSLNHGADREALAKQAVDTQLHAHADYDEPRGAYRVTMLAELLVLLASDDERAELESLAAAIAADLEAGKPIDPIAAQWAAFDELLDTTEIREEALYG
jgi:hypothetical protein